jgi:PAS domain-containing protein
MAKYEDVSKEQLLYEISVLRHRVSELEYLEIEHRRAEELRRTILSNVGAYIYLKDTDYRYTSVNNKVCSLFGLREDEIIGKDDTSFFSSPSVEEITRSDRRVIEHGETVMREEPDLHFIG